MCACVVCANIFADATGVCWCTWWCDWRVLVHLVVRVACVGAVGGARLLLQRLALDIVAVTRAFARWIRNHLQACADTHTYLLHVRVHMYTCTCTYQPTYSYAHAYTPIHTHVCVCLCVCVCEYVRAFMYIHVCVYTHLSTYSRFRHVHSRAYIHACNST